MALRGVSTIIPALSSRNISMSIFAFIREQIFLFHLITPSRHHQERDGWMAGKCWEKETVLEEKIRSILPLENVENSLSSLVNSLSTLLFPSIEEEGEKSGKEVYALLLILCYGKSSVELFVPHKSPFRPHTERAKSRIPPGTEVGWWRLKDQEEKEASTSLSSTEKETTMLRNICERKRENMKDVSACQSSYTSVPQAPLPPIDLTLSLLRPQSVVAPSSHPSSRDSHTDGVWIECHHCLPLLPHEHIGSSKLLACLPMFATQPRPTGDAFGIDIASVVTTDSPFPPVKGGSCLLTGTT
ncbi:hypothetical protein DMENIID0001_149650 [Sergentomyia squamirostris]